MWSGLRHRSKFSERRIGIRELIKERSPFDEEETNRILNKFFYAVPRSVKILVQNHQFDRKKVLDIGCSYGLTLLYWREDSEGVEIQHHMVEFVKALGRKVHVLNVDEGFSDLRTESYDAIYTNNLIEHLVSPHLFLVRLHSLLKPGGILAMGHPIVPPYFFRDIWKLFGYSGWLSVEHTNFFTPQTAKLTLERAGFKVKHQYSPEVGRIHPALSKRCVSIGFGLLSVCQRIDKFKYNPKRLLEFDPSWASDLEHFR